jgi:hypothetical protein
MSVEYREFLGGEVVYLGIGRELTLAEMQGIDSYLLKKIALRSEQIVVIVDMRHTIKYPTNIGEIRRACQFLKSERIAMVLHLVRDHFQKMLGDSVVALSWHKYKAFEGLDTLLGFLAEEQIYLKFENS